MHTDEWRHHLKQKTRWNFKNRLIIFFITHHGGSVAGKNKLFRSHELIIRFILGISRVSSSLCKVIMKGNRFSKLLP